MRNYHRVTPHVLGVAPGPDCPEIGERVEVVRKSGKAFVARIGILPFAIFRDPRLHHWLTDDDKFADVAFDPIVGWRRLTPEPS